SPELPASLPIVLAGTLVGTDRSTPTGNSSRSAFRWSGTLRGEVMRFTEVHVAGAYVIELEPHRDQRGSFARAWCQNEFAHHGLVSQLCQVNLSSTAQK